MSANFGWILTFRGKNHGNLINSDLHRHKMRIRQKHPLGDEIDEAVIDGSRLGTVASIVPDSP
jgi:hypothetical protein